MPSVGNETPVQTAPEPGSLADVLGETPVVEEGANSIGDPTGDVSVVEEGDIVGFGNNSGSDTAPESHRT